MSLADYWDGMWLPDGWHSVTIKDVRAFDAASGTSGVEFSCVDTNGNKTKASFYLTELAMWRLASFAKACGLTREQARNYNTDNPNSHRQLIGKRLRVEVVPDERDEKYHKVGDWTTDEGFVPPPVESPPESMIVDESPPPAAQDIPF